MWSPGKLLFHLQDATGPPGFKESPCLGLSQTAASALVITAVHLRHLDTQDLSLRVGERSQGNAISIHFPQPAKLVYVHLKSHYFMSLKINVLLVCLSGNIITCQCGETAFVTATCGVSSYSLKQNGFENRHWTLQLWGQALPCVEASISKQKMTVLQFTSANNSHAA